MRVYRIILSLLLAAAIAFGIWYCVSMYQEQGTQQKGLLVQDGYVEYDIY